MTEYRREELWRTLDNIAPLSLAGSWDNVGVLLDPPLLFSSTHSLSAMSDERILLTIDLTEEVFEEALNGGYTCIVAYHPIIFGGVKRLTQNHPQTRTLLRATQAGIGIYSPHTALDGVKGGVCDWLAAAMILPDDEALTLSTIRGITDHVGDEYQAIETALEDIQQGAGRRFLFSEPLSLETLCQRLDRRLNQEIGDHRQEAYLRTVTPLGASPTDIEIRSVALCPGAGGGLFETVDSVDLLITGEMRHHDLLHRAQSGTSVILTEHSRCERGYLPFYAQWIKAHTGSVVDCAQYDDDPIRLYHSPPR